MPAAVSSAGREAVDLAASAGLVLDGWEAQVLEDALGERADEKWAAFQVGLIVPRQNGKGSILEARELAGLFLFDEPLIVHTAHEFKTAYEAFLRIWKLIESTPDLESQVSKKLENNNGLLIKLRTGQRLIFVARSGSSGRGFSGDTVILDEAYQLSSEAVAALVPTMSARPNPQLWVTSSAPHATANSEFLRGFCRRGRAGEEAMAYTEYAADKDADPADPAAWAEANPAMPYRITEERIRLERPSLADEFPRERLGIWDDDINAGERVITAAEWKACEDVKSGPTDPVAFALDVSPDRQHAAFAVAGASALGGTHVEIVDHDRGTDWLVGRAKALQDEWQGCLAVAKGSPAASLLLELEQAGVDVLEVSVEDHAKACGQFYDDVIEGRVRHLGQPALTIAVAGGERKFYGDSWLWSRRSSTSDITPLVAVTLAKWCLDQTPEVEADFFTI